MLLVDMRDVLVTDSLFAPFAPCCNHGTTELFLDEMSAPAGSLIEKRGMVVDTFLTA